MSDNIKVVVKVRPLISREIEEKLQVQWRIENDTLLQFDSNGRDILHSFTFDKVYDEHTKTTDVYNDVARPIVEAAVSGFNGTIFAYGQTSSGKTYTMTGNDQEPGIIPLAVLNLFKKISTVTNRVFLVRVSYMEIYNEKIKDLLDINKQNIKIQESLQGIKVDVTDKVITSPEEVLLVMNEGKANRQTGATNMNEESSRSHSIFQIIIESREQGDADGKDGCVNVSQLNLVDLAGSERLRDTGATGLRFKEGTHINKSLSCLTHIIQQLSEDPNNFINYRNSKLTRILQNSLGGNSKTSIICAITPASAGETLSTLQFANRAKAIKNKPIVNEVVKNAGMVQKLSRELSKLHHELESKKNLEQDNNKLTAKIAALQKYIMTFGERRNETVTSSRQKKCAPRRVTISTLHSIEEDPPSSIPRFCTPGLKYNPLTLPPEVSKNNGMLAPVSEEVRPGHITPPPREKSKFSSDEVIYCDSDSDDDSSIRECSPYHTCQETSKTPPCVTKKYAKSLEKNINELLDSTKIEKMYPPNHEHLIEKLEQNTVVITRLQEEVITFKQNCDEKDGFIKDLKIEISRKDEELQSLTSLKTELETQCKEYNVKLTDLEVSYETLKNKSRSRENDLLSLIQEQSKPNSANSKSTSKQIEKELSNFMDISKELSLVSSDNEDEETTSHNKSLIASLEKSTKELQQTIESCEYKLKTLQNENDLLKSTIDTLNSTIKCQKESLNDAATDIELHKTKISELETKLKNNDREINSLIINDEILENMIANEENLIASNENIDNIIKSFRHILDMRNIEIDKLRASESSSLEASTKNIALSKEIQDKSTEIESLVKDLEDLRKQLNSCVEVVDDLKSENKNIKNAENLLVKELSEIRLQVEVLSQENDVLNKAKQALEETNRQQIADLETKIQEDFCKEKDSQNQIEQLSQKVSELLTDIKNKDKTIKTLIDDNKTKHLVRKLDCLVEIINETLVALGENNIQTSSHETSDFLAVCEQLCSSSRKVYSCVLEFVNQKNDLLSNSVKLNEKVTVLTNLHELEVKQLTTEIENLQILNNDVSSKCDDLVSQNNLLTCEIEKLQNDVTIKQEEHNDLISKFNDLEKSYICLQNESGSKEDVVRSKEIEHESQISLITEQHKFAIEQLEKSLMDQLSEKDKEKCELDQKYFSLKSDYEQMRSQIISITKNIREIKHSYNLMDLETDNLELKDFNHIIQDFENLAKEVKTLMNSNDLNKLTEQVLAEAKQEILMLKDQIVHLTRELSAVHENNLLIMPELEAMQKENKKLVSALSDSKVFLEQLQLELNEKENKKSNTQSSIEQWNEKYYNIKSSLEVEINMLKQENHKLQLQCSELNHKITTTQDSNNIHISPEKSFVEIIDMLSPPNLKTMCYMKVFELIQPKENNSITISNSNSEMSVETSSELNQSHHCNCERLVVELSTVLEENVKLKNILREMEATNLSLLKEQEEVREETKKLLEPILELQKKIGNHRTNLSTLTATTHTENKLLKSQVKVLQYHHNRCHNVCQKDLPAVKKQLNDLLAILRNEHFDKHNVSFKRFSLSDVLDKNCSMSAIKNESTLDGDLLMLDTNVTMTSADNTLLGPDQSCLDITQICLDTEASSQIDPSVLYSQIQILTQENQKLVTVIEMVKEENVSLYKQLNDVPVTKQTKLVDAENSPIRIRKSLEKTETHNMELEEKINLLQKELLQIKSEKAVLKEKYDNLSLEVPSSEALVKKLHSLDIEYNALVQEHSKLKKNKKHLQDENDELSTQLFDNINAVDDLKKQLDAEQQNNSKIKAELSELTKQIKEPSVTPKKLIDCQQCSVKDEIIKKFKTKIANETHSKLNRSNSDSESASRCNKIFTLQNELQESIEDCIKINEKVTTIKNHLDRSDLSICQSMDLDESMRDSNIFALTKDFEVVESKIQNLSENAQHDYAQDKNECFCFYLEKIGSEKENLSQNVKIIDIMKMFYNKLVTKHTNEVENLVNNLCDFEEAKQNLQKEMNEKVADYLEASKLLEEKDKNLKTVGEVLFKIRTNIASLNDDVTQIIDSPDINILVVDIVKEKLFKVLDCEFGTQSINTFEKLVDRLVNKHQNDISVVMNKYTDTQNRMENVSLSLNEVNKTLEAMKTQLAEKEKECNLLKVQKEKVTEITNAVTLDIVKKEEQLSTIIRDGFKKLIENHIINENDINLSLPTTEIVNSLYNFILHTNAYKIELTNKFKTSEAEIQKQKSQNKEILSELEKQTSNFESLKIKYECMASENSNNVNVIETLTTEVNKYKNMFIEMESKLNSLSNKQNADDSAKVSELVDKLSSYEQEINTLKSINDIIKQEKESCAHELEEANKRINENKHILNKMSEEMIVLNERIKVSTEHVDTLKSEAKTLLEQNQSLKEDLQTKVSEGSRLESNIKIHQKTAEIQNGMIKRLQNQQESDKKIISEKESCFNELTQKYASLEQEYEVTKQSLASSLEEIKNLKTIKENLEMRICELELESGVSRPRSSLDGIMENSRRRRQSLHDSKRLCEDDINDNQVSDHNKLEAMFGSRSKADDFFMDVDEDGSRGTTPASLGRRRNSFISRHENSHGDDNSSSRNSLLLATATRRRRQSVHDQHRAVITPEPDDHPINKLRNSISKSASSSANNSIDSANETSKLRDRLAQCQQELEELKERYKELDEECEICSEYLKERDDQCMRLKKEKADLMTQVEELKKRGKKKRSYTDATVNTDEDWANLHNVVVDRMSFDAEVEKNKTLTKAIEEFRSKNRDLKATLVKMQQTIEKYAERGIEDLTKELETTRTELRNCKSKLEDLKEKYKELDEECEICSQYLNERDEQIRKLKEAKNSLERKIEEYQSESNVGQSLRKKRQSLHDQNRGSVATNDASTTITDDLLLYQVERDDSSLPINENKIKQLQLTVEKLKENKAALERQLRDSNVTPVYVSTGSAIVQNQQMTDVLKENLKLKKLNAKLVTLCKKRGKSITDSNRENDDPSELG